MCDSSTAIVTLGNRVKARGGGMIARSIVHPRATRMQETLTEGPRDVEVAAGDMGQAMHDLLKVYNMARRE